MSDLFRSANRAGSGSGALPDNEGNTELMSPASLVRVDAARRSVERRVETRAMVSLKCEIRTYFERLQEQK